MEGAFAQFPDASSAQDESARRLFLQPLSLAGETSCEAFPHLLSAGPSVDGSAGGLADRGISLSLLERRAIWIGMQDAAAGYGPLPPGSTWIRRLYRRFCRWTAQANLQPLSNPRLEAFRYLGLKFGQDAADLIEDNRKLEDRNPCCLSGEISPVSSTPHPRANT